MRAFLYNAVLNFNVLGTPLPAQYKYNQRAANGLPGPQRRFHLENPDMPLLSGAKNMHL
ncbi:hypothetical protein [Pontibacter flavimaris]|uniref:hypothetical protein n=1 Tax=Pontibacter flavimaris TaxID=1797110 RepID=UPI00147A00B2|nr:hypothetical protein [Pontibacter flavimaris]